MEADGWASYKVLAQLPGWVVLKADEDAANDHRTLIRLINADRELREHITIRFGADRFSETQRRVARLKTYARRHSTGGSRFLPFFLLASTGDFLRVDGRRF